MSLFRFWILSLLLLSTVPAAMAQENLNYSFRHISHADGLLHNEVLSIVQDGKGFIWIATRNGLQRYDGSRFTNYPEILSDPGEGISYNAEMYIDKKRDLLWITSKTAIKKVELGSKHFYSYSEDKILEDSSFVFSKYTDRLGRRWLLGHNGVYFYQPGIKKYGQVHINISPLNSHQAAYMAFDAESGNTWLVNGELFLFDKDSKRVRSKESEPDSHPLFRQQPYNVKGNFFRFVMIDSRKNIWLTTWSDSLYRYDNETKRLNSYSLSNIVKKERGNYAPGLSPLVNCMLEDDDHTIWIGTEYAGLLRYNYDTGGFDYAVADAKYLDGPRYSSKIISLFQDRERNIWVGTDKGVSIFNPYAQHFSAIRHNENTALTIPKSEIISFIQATNGDLFIGTWGGGVGIYDKEFRFKRNMVMPGADKGNFVWSFVQSDDETIWMGCQHGTLMICNTTTGAVRKLQPPEADSSTIRCMVKDKANNIWLGLDNGRIIKWDRGLNKFVSQGPPQNYGPKTGVSILDMFIDDAQRCWVSTAKGFRQFDLQTRTFMRSWLPDKENKNSISARTCQGIEEYNDSILLIGSFYGGLNFFNRNTGDFSHLTTIEGMPANNVHAIRKGAGGYIWFTTDYGLFRFNPADKKIIPYNIDDGVINSSFIANHFYPLQDGQWLTFSVEEAISFFPRKMEDHDSLQQKTEITGFRIFDKSVFIDSLLPGNLPLRLSYKQNFFTVEFAALSFSSLQEASYYYRLVGVDKEWVNGGARRFASYTDLQPGEYVFEVKSENGPGSGEPTSFNIIIEPPFWKTPWFLFIAVAAVLFLVFLFIKGRERNIKAIEAEKLKVQRLNAEQYKSKLEMEQIINYFSSSLVDKHTIDDVLWDVARNLIGRLGFVDCIMYLWNEDKTTMIQKAGYGVKGSIEAMNKLYFDVLPGQGVVGYVMQTKEPVFIPDTSKDGRYRPDEMTRLSEITVPVIYNNELIGVIDSEHHEKNFFTMQHLQILNTIATLMANKIKSIEAEQSLQQSRIEVYSINEQLSTAKLEALRSQMNPHFIFNCINSIDGLIHSNDKYNATVYLNKFAKLIRNILDSSKQNVVPFSKDIETLKLYIELEELRHEKKFSSYFNIDPELLTSDYKVPPLIVQPFVENAILHGLKNKEGEEGMLTVTIIKVDEQIQYRITDNGIGREAAGKIMQNKESHYGMQMSYDRIRLFNKEESESVTVTDIYKDGLPNGTEVKVNLNII